MPSKREVRPEDDPFAPEFFSWKVRDTGYRWEPRTVFESIGAVRSPHTARVLISPGSGAGREYRPLAEPALFRRFSDCRIHEADMAAFAGAYGFLGVGVELNDFWEKRWPKGLTKANYGEPLAIWQDEILAMRAAVRIWDRLESGSVKNVPIFVLPDPHSIGNLPETGPYQSADDIRAECVFAVGIADDDLATHHYFAEIGGEHPFLGHPTLGSADAAWPLLIRLVNHRLLRHCGPYLFDRTPSRHSLMVRVSPQNLLGAIWWQFGRVVSGEASYRRCKVCRGLIELSKGAAGFRADREFCSQACKARDHRGKVKQVKQLRAKGWKVMRIAKRFDTDPETVKNWLAKKK